MNTFAFFVSEDWIKTNTPLTENVDVKEIYPFIKSSQDIYIQDKLGSKLYNRLIDGVINNNLNANEIELLMLIRPSLAYYCVHEALPFLANKLRNIGIVETADVKQKNADRADRKELRQECLNKAEFYMQRVNDYLCKNGKLFAEYITPDNPLTPNKSNSFTCDLDLSDDIDKHWIKKYYK